MTDERLAELERLASAATPGPWFPRWGGEPGYVYSQSAERVIAMLADEQNDGLPRPNSQLIAAARTAVPELLTEVRRLQESLHFLQSRYDSLNLAADQYCESRDRWRMERMAYHRAVALLEPATRDLVMKWAAEDIQRYTADGEQPNATP